LLSEYGKKLASFWRNSIQQLEIYELHQQILAKSITESHINKELLDMLIKFEHSWDYTVVKLEIQDF